MIEGHVLDLLPAYSLGCLDEGDDLLVAEHLATCKICRAELDTYTVLAADLPLAMNESDPPPDLRDKILQRARAAELPATEAQNPSLWQRLIRQDATPAWSLVSLVLILVLAASNLYLWGRLNSLENRRPDGLMAVQFQGTNAAPNATGLLVISLDGMHGTMVVDQLPVLGETEQYQLWLIQDGERTSGGVFSVDTQGYKSLYIDSPEPLASYSAFGITVEPAGGSPGPTGEKVLGGEL